MPLDAVLHKHVDEREIDLLKIDVEGAERFVLETIDLAKWRPRVLIIEAVAPKQFRKTHEDWSHLIEDAHYAMCLFDGVNRIYVRRDQGELAERLSWPVCSLDRYKPAEMAELDEFKRFGRVARATARLMQACMDRIPRSGGRHIPAVTD
jgi:hypothetical protein